jgi:hypothetical protein
VTPPLHSAQGDPRPSEPLTGPGEDRLNGPGWNDWCYVDDEKTQIPEVWHGAPGADVIDTDESRSDARDGWWRIICTRLYSRQGATLNELEDDPQLAWFHLRLTRNEIASLLWSASAEGLVTSPGGVPQHRADVLDHPEWTWLCTTSATENRRYVGPPLGASARDVLKHAWPRASLAQTIGAAAAGVLAGLIFALGNDLGDKDKPLLGITAALAAVPALAVLASYGALREERVLRRMLDAWPRGRDYRPARNRFEHMRLRSVIPWALTPLVAAAVLAAGVSVWQEREQISTAWMNRGYAAAAAIGGAAVVVALILHARAWRPRRRLLREKDRRANPPGRETDVLR